MRRQEESDFFDLFEIWVSQWPSAKLKPGTRTAYYMVLQFFDFDIVKRALDESARGQKWMPGAQAVRDHCVRMQREKNEKTAKPRQQTFADVEQRKTFESEEAAQAYIDAAEKDYERLARTYEVEAWRASLTGRKISRDQASEILKTYNKTQEQTYGDQRNPDG